MKEQGGPVIMVLGLFSLLWLLGSAPAKVEPVDMPVDGLVEQVAAIKESLVSEPSNNPGGLDHIADAGQKVDPQPSPSDRHEKAKREIIIFTRPNCPPCEKWKRCEMQRFMDAGWSVGIVEVHGYGLTPTFEIQSGDKKATIKGYMTLEQAVEAVR